MSYKNSSSNNHSSAKTPSIAYLVVMSIVTLFAPYIGTYFLCRPNVPKPLLYCAVGWCAFIGIGCLQPSDEYSTSVRIMSFLSCMAPIVFFLYQLFKEKKQERIRQEEETNKRIETLLSTPLETFGEKYYDVAESTNVSSYNDAMLEELAKKYSD